MTDAQRRALEELGERYILSPPDAGGPPASGDTQPGRPRSAFENPELPLILEIGFGMGEATAELADRQSRFNFLGVEVHRPGVGKLLLEIEKRELRNLRISTVDAVTIVRDQLADKSLAGVHIFFPDPWPKKRHHKRRLIQPEFLRLLSRRIAPGGYLYLVTDWEDYAEQMLEALKVAFAAGERGTAGGGLINPYAGFAPHRPWRPTTSFERKAKAKGHSIYELFLIKKASGIVAGNGYS
jgi:tRNA (guanine-N7-)-methyltransferase